MKTSPNCWEDHMRGRAVTVSIYFVTSVTIVTTATTNVLLGKQKKSSFSQKRNIRTPRNRRGSFPSTCNL